MIRTKRLASVALVSLVSLLAAGCRSGPAVEDRTRRSLLDYEIQARGLMETNLRLEELVGKQKQEIRELEEELRTFRADLEAEREKRAALEAKEKEWAELLLAARLRHVQLEQEVLRQKIEAAGVGVEGER